MSRPTQQPGGVGPPAHAVDCRGTLRRQADQYDKHIGKAEYIPYTHTDPQSLKAFQASSILPPAPRTASQRLPMAQPPSGQRPVVQPCRYKTGKTLGAGSYSVVKECVHIDTGRYYAAKVINKRLMAGREHMVGNRN